ncbi:MAG: glycyl-radical enzyme activating protein [Oscillibacter sp.]|nr:glycyl-radical enzyme activating protein [Oscillibacter sp.]
MGEDIRDLRGLVLRTEKGSVYDGDGMRTVVYMKGCPLHCWWCSTPESQNFGRELGYMKERCVGCGKCIVECPADALQLDANSGIIRDRKKCIACTHCVDACAFSAHKVYGTVMTVQEVLDLVAQDSVLYFFSGGGLTFGGGECLGQADFIAEVMKGCHRQGINTTIETTLAYPWREVEKVLPHVDVVYVDMKVMDELAHKKYVGGSTELIRGNLEKIDNSDYPVKIRIRVPTIPGINDTEQNMEALSAFCRSFQKIEYIELLPYHRLGIETYRELGIPYKLPNIKVPDDKKMIELARYMNGLEGTIPVLVGGVCYR